MGDAAPNLPIQTTEKAEPSKLRHPIETLRREIDHLFEDFDQGFWRAPFRRSVFDVAPHFRREISWGNVPAIDICETDQAFEVTVEMPGMNEKDIEIKLANGGITIRGEKKHEKEEKKKDYYLSERRYGLFERFLHVPEGVDTDKIAASFKHGVLTVTLPKTPEAKKTEKTIEVKPG